MKTNKCPVCSSPMVYETRVEQFEYKGETLRFDSEGWWCTDSDCAEGIIEGEALSHSFEQIRAFKARVDGVLSPEQVRSIRELLGLSQREAGALLGGGPRAFQKYEAGKVGVSQAMSHLLRLLEHDRARLEEIRSFHQRAQNQTTSAL